MKAIIKKVTHYISLLEKSGEDGDKYRNMDIVNIHYVWCTILNECAIVPQLMLQKLGDQNSPWLCVLKFYKSNYLRN